MAAAAMGVLLGSDEQKQENPFGGKPKRKSKTANVNGAEEAEYGKAETTSSEDIPSEEAPQAEAEPEPVSGVELLADVEKFVKKYLILPSKAYFAVALWIVATHVSIL